MLCKLLLGIKMKIIIVETDIGRKEAEKFIGNHPTVDDYDIVLDDNHSTTVLRPNGEVLIKLIRNSIPTKMANVAFNILHEAPLISKNRGMSTQKGEQKHIVNPNGTKSKTNQLEKPINSGIIGYYDRYTRTPYCRSCSWNREHPDKWHKLLPFISHVDSVFKEYYPQRYAVQQYVAQNTHPEWVIGETAFSTVTVNKNYQTSCHYDAGDLHDGYGVMACLRGGKFDGGLLVIPRYKVAVNIKSQDIILFDVHEVHGNTRIIKKQINACRMTCVFYLRENIVRCGTSQEELNRVKNRRQGMKLWSDKEVEHGNKIISQAKQLLIVGNGIKQT